MKICKNFHNFKNKYKGLYVKKIFKKNTDEFCKNTTLHGLKYIADKDLKTSDR